MYGRLNSHYSSQSHPSSSDNKMENTLPFQDRSLGNPKAGTPWVCTVCRWCKSRAPQLSCRQLDQSKTLCRGSTAPVSSSQNQVFSAGMMTKALCDSMSGVQISVFRCYNSVEESWNEEYFIHFYLFTSAFSENRTCVNAALQWKWKQLVSASRERPIEVTGIPTLWCYFLLYRQSRFFKSQFVQCKIDLEIGQNCNFSCSFLSVMSY